MGRAKKSAEVEAQVIARGNVVPMMTETESEETVQYVSDEDAAREDRLVSEIRMITEQTKQVVLFNSIEIGRRLTEAKAMVKRGTWGTWLKERVDYSQRTANNFMKIYQEYGRNGLAEKSQALANLSYTQALASAGRRRCCSRQFAGDLPRCSGPIASSSFHRAFQRSLL